MSLSTLLWWFAAYAVAALLLSKVLLPWLSRRIDTGPFDGLVLVVIRTYLWLWHRPRRIGFDRLPDPLPKAFVVVANHASGIDPLLLQAPFDRRIRWLMARDQMAPILADAWRHIDALAVNYGPEDAAVLKEAVRHVRAGGVLGLFPEGAIARPPREIRPFLGGVGVIMARAKVPVLLFHIEDAPYTATAFGSLLKPSRTTVRFVGVFDPIADGGRPDAPALLEQLRRALAEASGWPLNDDPMVERRAVRSEA